VILPAFEEKYAAHSPGGYPVTNEEPETIRRMLKGYKFNRVGGIAGGGEVSIFTLLPYANELLCVDHSHRAIVALYIKLALLQKHGINGMRKVLEERKIKDFFKEATTVIQHLPEALRSKVKFPDPAKYDYYGTYTMSNEDYSNMRKEWNILPDAIFRKVLGKLDRVKILHGDLRKDMEPYGKFDLFYISNAHQHVDRDSKTLKIADLVPLLNDKGMLLVAGELVTSPKNPELKVVKSIKGFRTTWSYTLFQKIKPRRAKKPATIEAIHATA